MVNIPRANFVDFINENDAVLLRRANRLLQDVLIAKELLGFGFLPRQTRRQTSTQCHGLMTWVHLRHTKSKIIGLSAVLMIKTSQLE